MTTVPTALERVGNFDADLAAGRERPPVPAQLFNPYSVTQFAPDLYQRAPITPAIVTALYMPEGPAAYNAALAMFNFYPARTGRQTTPTTPTTMNHTVKHAHACQT